MTRIVAGVAGGRRLVVPAGGQTRPTADRVREALFSTLGSLLGSLDGLVVLDLYAGSGALGLEALSRGAAHVTFVDNDRAAQRALRANIASVGLGSTTVARNDVAGFLAGAPAPPTAPVDLLLADPPYRTPADDVAALLGRAARHGWLAADAVLVLERPSREPPPSWPAELVALRKRQYSETTLWYLRRSDDEVHEPIGGGPCAGAPAPGPSTR